MQHMGERDEDEVSEVRERAKRALSNQNVRKAIISIASEADSLPPFINRGGFSELTPADEPLSIFGVRFRGNFPKKIRRERWMRLR